MKLSELSFEQHFEFFKNKILNYDNFVFARYADGERLILENTPILYGTQALLVDKWKFKDNFIFSKDLENTCGHKEDNYFYAISCTCCDPKGEKYYRNKLQNHNITFSNLFINSNYSKFIQMVENLNRKVFLFANKNCLTADYPFDIIEKMPIENDCVNWYEKNKDMLLKVIKSIAEKYNDQLFFISAGPLSEIIIHNLYVSNPNNSYIDVGSSLDVYTHKTKTREYQNKDSAYNTKTCIFGEKNER